LRPTHASISRGHGCRHPWTSVSSAHVGPLLASALEARVVSCATYRLVAACGRCLQPETFAARPSIMSRFRVRRVLLLPALMLGLFAVGGCSSSPSPRCP